MLGLVSLPAPRSSNRASHNTGMARLSIVMACHAGYWEMPNEIPSGNAMCRGEMSQPFKAEITSESQTVTIERG